MNYTIDLEDVLASIEEILKEKLNGKISLIEAQKAEKGLALIPTLKPVLNDSYYLQTWNDRILEVSPAIYYGIESINAIDGGAGIIVQEIRIFIEAIILDSGDNKNSDGMKRVFRYARALKEVFEESFKDQRLTGQVKIETVRPEAIRRELDSSEELKIGGILLTTTLF